MSKSDLISFFTYSREADADQEASAIEDSYGLSPTRSHGDATVAPATGIADPTASRTDTPSPGGDGLSLPGTSTVYPDEVRDRLAKFFGEHNDVAPDMALSVVGEILDSPNKKWDPKSRQVVLMTPSELALRKDELKAGPDENWRDWVTRTIGPGWAQGKYEGDSLNAGLVDVIPGVEFGAAVADVKALKDREAAGEDVSMLEKALTYLAVPASALPLMGIASRAGAKAIRESVVAARSAKLSLADDIIDTAEKGMLRSGAVPQADTAKVPRFMVDDQDPELLKEIYSVRADNPNITDNAVKEEATNRLTERMGSGQFQPEQVGMPEMKEMLKQAKSEAKQPPKPKKVTNPVSMVKVGTKEAEDAVGDLGAYLSWAGEDSTKYLEGNIPNINLDYMKTTDDIQAALEFVADSVKIPSNVQGWEETAKAALAELLNQPVDRMKYVFDNQYTSSRHIVAAKVMLENASRQVSEFAKVYDPLTASVEDKAKALRMVQQLADIYAFHTGIRAEAGRALNATKIMDVESKKLMGQLKELVDGEAGGKVDDIMNAMKMASNASEATQIARVAVHGNRFWNSAIELWMASVLSSVKTFSVNAIGTAFNLVKELPEREIGAFMGTGRQAMGGEGSKIAHGESIAMLFGMLEGMPEALMTFGRAFKSGRPVFSEKMAASGNPNALLSKIPGMRQPAISSTSYGMKSAFKQGTTIRGAAENTIQDPMTIFGSIVDVFGAVVRSPLNLMQSTDEMNKVLAYRMQVNARAYRDTMNYGVKGFREKAQIFSDLKRTPPEDIRLDAMSFADYVTFQKPLGETGTKLQGIINKGYTKYDIPLLRFIAPFQRTIQNIFTQGVLERTPIGYLSKSFQEDLAAGGARADAARARMYAGTAVVMMAAWESAKGNIVGPAPKNPGQRTAFFQYGKKPYSLRVPDGYDANGSPKFKYIQFNRMEPVAFGLALGATIGDYMHSMDPENPEHQRTLETMVNSAVGAVGNYIADRQYLVGIADAIDAVRGNKSAYDWASRYTSSWVPAASFDVVRSQDRVIRDTHDFMDKAMSRIPGYAEELPPSVNTWGEPIKRDNGLLFGWADPIAVSESSVEPIDKEIYRLGVDGVDTGDGNKRIFPEALISMPERDIDGKRMDSNQYFEFMSQVGPMAKDRLNELVQSSEYDSLPPFAKATAIRSIWSSTVKSGKDVFRTRPEFIEHSQEVRDSNRRLIEMGIK